MKNTGGDVTIRLNLAAALLGAATALAATAADAQVSGDVVRIGVIYSDLGGAL